MRKKQEEVEEGAIFMIVYDKVPNTMSGEMRGKFAIVGEPYPIPTKGILKLLKISEGFGHNGKPVLTIIYENNVVVELPDYGIEKCKFYSHE